MKLLPNKTFPHPVLWNRADDYVRGEFRADATLLVGESVVPVVNCKFSVTDESICKHIREQAAAYVLEIHCPSTYFRRVFQTEKESNEFRLEKGDLHIRAELTAFVVCTKPIQGYTSENFNAEFGTNASFNLQIGDVLAATETQIYNCNTEFFKPLNSVIDLVASPQIDRGQFEVDTNETRIKIKMHPRDKMLFESMRKSSEQKPTAMFVYFAAVAEVLRQMKEGEDSDSKWYRTIESQLAEINQTVTDMDPFVTAQKLMHHPFGFLLPSESGD